MKVLITYDLNIRHPEVKSELEKLGFADSWESNTVTYYLPNTTLWHNNLLTTDNAENIFLNVIEDLNVGQPPQRIIKAERFIAVPINSWSGIPGEPHSK